MAESLKSSGASNEWLERPDDGLSPEQRQEKGQIDFIAEGILKEVEENEMRQTFEGMGQPTELTVAEVREKTDFQEAPKVQKALKEIRAAAEAYARENDASFMEGLEQQLADYEGQIAEADSEEAKENLVEKAAWNSVLLDSLNDMKAEQAARAEMDEKVAKGEALPGDVL